MHTTAGRSASTGLGVRAVGIYHSVGGGGKRSCVQLEWGGEGGAIGRVYSLTYVGRQIMWEIRGSEPITLASASPRDDKIPTHGTHGVGMYNAKQTPRS